MKASLVAISVVTHIMAEPVSGTGHDGLPPRRHQSVSGEYFGNEGISGSNIGRDAVNVRLSGSGHAVTLGGEGDVVRDAVRTINACGAKELFDLFCTVPQDYRGTVLYLIRLDKGIALLTTMREREGLDAVLAHLTGLDEKRVAEFLGTEGMLQSLRIEVAARLPAEKMRVVLSELGADHPEHAAQLIEQLASSERISGSHAVIAILPEKPVGRRFLAFLPPTASAASVLTELPKDEQQRLLSSLSSQDVRRYLILADRINAAALIEVLPAELTKQELNQLTIGRLASLLASLGPGQSARLTGWISRDRLMAALADSSMDETPWLEHMEPSQAAEILERMPPARAAGRLQRVRTGTAAEVLQVLSGAPFGWLADVLAALPDRLRAALPDRVAMKSGADADRLRAVLSERQRPLTTGWPRVDAALTMLSTAGPALRRLDPQYRDTSQLGTALGREIADARGLWRAMRQSSVRRPVENRKQRNYLAVALVLALVALACMIAIR
jgi:flagellar motility protein MotE (MotC chaperone)